MEETGSDRGIYPTTHRDKNTAFGAHDVSGYVTENGPLEREGSDLVPLEPPASAGVCASKSLLQMKFLLTLCCLLVVTGFLGCKGQNFGWRAVEKSIRTSFPEVRQLPPDSLAQWLTGTAPSKPILLDTRTPSEYAVSHLPGAVRVDPEAVDFQFLSSIPKDAPIVLYCSVGYRSSSLAERMQQAGWTNIYNLEGSLFRWVSRGYPVYRGATPLTPPQVHPYNALWGRLLEARYHAYAPPPDSLRR